MNTKGRIQSNSILMSIIYARTYQELEAHIGNNYHTGAADKTEHTSSSQYNNLGKG